MLTLLSLFVLVTALGSLTIVEGTPTSTDTPLTYWYTGQTFDVNKEDDWIPFFSGTDVPHSLPLRGFISDTRNYFLDFGAVNWLSDWIDYRYGWEMPDYERNLLDNDVEDQLEYLFETMTSRFQKPHSYVDEQRHFYALDYVKDFNGSFDAFIPLIVMYGLNDSYDEVGMREWVIHPDIVEESLNEAFPLVSWQTKLYWYNYDNAIEFADLMNEKKIPEGIWMDDDFLNRTDVILHDIISAESEYDEYDMVLPTLIMLQEHTLIAATYDPPWAVGGLGRLHSAFPEIDSWCLNGRGVESYFFAANPNHPRAAITPTVVHELGHCIGQTDIHSLFGWFASASTISAMCAYQQPTTFDRFDKDLITNGQALQLLGRYLDELDYFRSLTSVSSHLTELQALEYELSSIPQLLIATDTDALSLLFSGAEELYTWLSDELNEPRKSDDWSSNAPALDVKLDWIVGPGIPNPEIVAEAIELELQTNREIVLFTNTTLPTPRYNVSIEVHATSESFNDAVFHYWGSSLSESVTSSFSADLVPEDAFSTWPRNRVFQNQSGYSIEGNAVEEWLSKYPYTMEDPDKMHYRFYMMNLENIILIGQDFTPVILSVTVGIGVLIAAIVLVTRKRKS
jgi:hypothetical protein